MKVLVCGGRYFNDDELLFDTLNKICDQTPITKIINGGANGADYLATVWANNYKIPYTVYPANWDQHGYAAGPIRNSEMLKENPDLVVAFAGGKGTQDMINKAKKANIKVLEVK